jgi:cell division control protein 7
LIEGLRYQDQITFVLEYIPHVEFTNLLHVMGPDGIKNYMKQLFIALEHIHSHGIVHRDLKPSNFLVNPVENQYRLVDFGLSEYLDNTNKIQFLEKIQGKIKYDLPVVSRAGTKGFRAPEILLRHPIQTTAIDMWSSGVILLSLLTNRYPFFQSHDDLYALTEILNIIPFQEIETKFLKAYSKIFIFSHKTGKLLFQKNSPI